jgi:ABC-type sulfate transport system permease component
MRLSHVTAVTNRIYLVCRCYLLLALVELLIVAASSNNPIETLAECGHHAQKISRVGVTFPVSTFESYLARAGPAVVSWTCSRMNFPTET